MGGDAQHTRASIASVTLTNRALDETEISRPVYDGAVRIVSQMAQKALQMAASVRDDEEHRRSGGQNFPPHIDREVAADIAAIDIVVDTVSVDVNVVFQRRNRGRVQEPS